MGILEVVFGVVGRLLWGPAAAAAGSFLRPGGVDGIIGQQGNCLLPDPDPEEGVIGQGMNKL